MSTGTLERPPPLRPGLPRRRGPSTMTRVVVAAAIGLLFAVGFELLEERWETTEDVLVPGSRSELVVDVRVARGPVDTAADALVSACAWVVPDHAVTLVGPGDRDGRYVVDVEPALEHHGRRKLVGCLEDGTLDRVWGDVRTIERFDP
jgi:hypothetical protein